MKILRLILPLAIALSSATPGLCAPAPAQDWKAIVKQRLPVYGHRNWIVIADAAYPEQSAPGIETIDSNADQPEVLQFVLNAVAAAKHVAPIVYMDRELSFVPEDDAPGIGSFRESVKPLLGSLQPDLLAHEKIIAKLADVSQQFRVLIIKTKLTLPYTTVFLQLDCRYWSPDAEARLRAVMAANR